MLILLENMAISYIHIPDSRLIGMLLTGNHHHSRNIPEEVRHWEMLNEARQEEGHCTEQREILYVNNVKMH